LTSLPVSLTGSDVKQRTIRIIVKPFNFQQHCIVLSAVIWFLKADFGSYHGTTLFSQHNIPQESLNNSILWVNTHNMLDTI